jgi:tyrosine-protein phosphatase SIW14
MVGKPGRNERAKGMMMPRTQIKAAALMLACIVAIPVCLLSQSKQESTANLAAAAEPALRQLTAPCDTCMPGVRNFAKESPALWRGAQPTADGFRALEAAGIKTIVNLRHDHDDLPLLSGTKLKYLWLPSRTWSPDEHNIVLFLRVLRDTSNWPVFVHCAQGRDRTGVAVASYRMAVQGWTADEAIKEMHVFHNNWWWIENAKFVRKLDTTDIKQRMQLAP